MRTMGDRELLETYAKNRSEVAFAELVRRHLAWVYSVAQRQVGDSQLAEDVAQSVFVLLAQKAGSLSRQILLSGWLFRTTRFVANRALRTEYRRRRREEIASAMSINTLPEENALVWERLAPYLEEAMAALSETDRSVILLRFYEKKSLLEIAQRLGLREEAAKKRVSRAVEKLRDFLARRGVTLSSAMLASILAEQTVQALPVAVAAGVLKAASVAGMSAVLPQLVRDTLQAWRWAKLKLAAGIIVVSATCLIVATNTGPWRTGNAKPESPSDRGVLPTEQANNADTPSRAKRNEKAAVAAPIDKSLFFVVRDSETGGTITQAEIHVNYVVAGQWIQRDDLATDVEGICQVPVPSQNLARIDIGALKNGYEEKFITWRPAAGDQVPLTYTLRLGKAAPIGGWVRDESGNAIPDAEIIVQFDGTGDSDTREPGGERLGFNGDLIAARSDREGRWACSVVPAGLARGRFSIRAQHAGYLPGGTGQISLEVLREMQAVLVLRQGQSVTGLVVDELDHAIPGARVWAGLAEKPTAQTVTDKSGHFLLENLRGGLAVTVMAEGFATDQQEIDTDNPSNPLQFRLSPAPPLRFRVVDESGQPVPDCDLALENWWGQRSSIHFRRPTDRDGRLEWLSAPRGELEFCALKDGYRYSRGNKLRADGQEHTVVLRDVLIVTGNVADAETGEPLASFKVIPGYSKNYGRGEETRIIWDRSERRFGSNGVYRLIMTEENIPKVRIEAENYEVAEAEPPQHEPLESTCDFLLRRMDTNRLIRGFVLLPDGGPAAGVEVALCTYQCGVMLNGTRFDTSLFGNGIREPLEDYRCKTDQRGGFSFGPKPRAHTVFAVGAAGLGKVHCYDWSHPLEIRLEPWGRISGTVRTWDNQWAARKIIWTSHGELFDGMTLFYSAGAVAATSDVDGNFTIENVPPGIGRIEIEETTSHHRICLTPVEVPPGKTIQVQVGGTGLPVSGRLVAPPGIEVRSWSNQVQIAQLDSESSLLPVPD